MTPERGSWLKKAAGAYSAVSIWALWVGVSLAGAIRLAARLEPPPCC